MTPPEQTTEGDARGEVAGGGLLGPRIAGVALLALGAVLIVSALGITRGGGYQLIGPATVPLVVAIVLLVLAAAFTLRTTVWTDTDLAERAAEEERACHWITVGLIGLVLVGYALALDGFRLGPIDLPGLGYVIATGLFLPLAARILGSRSPIRDIVAGFGIGIVVYIGFTQFLGVRLPAGILGLIL
jgi:putative tricarboxylic transport membrane protein